MSLILWKVSFFVDTAANTSTMSWMVEIQQGCEVNPLIAIWYVPISSTPISSTPIWSTVTF